MNCGGFFLGWAKRFLVFAPDRGERLQRAGVLAIGAGEQAHQGGRGGGLLGAVKGRRLAVLVARRLRVWDDEHGGRAWRQRQKDPCRAQSLAEIG